ncbi:MAG: hypothetical protein J5857_08170 [Treponema sp.]|nr:hypothetical protein [Treponema sp.]
MDETNMTEQQDVYSQNPEGVIQHKCPGCGAPIKYSPDAESIVCEYCGGTFSIEQIKDSEEKNDVQFDWGDYKRTLSGEKLGGTLTYACQSCGAVIETPKTTMATKCPYCNNNVVVKNTATGGLKPNLIIPFAVTKDGVKKILKKISSEKKYLPFNYFKSCREGEIQGLYVPYWLFSSVIKGSIRFTGHDSDTHYSGDSKTTTTKVYEVFRSGQLEISRLPVDASIKINNEKMDSIEPFDYSKLTAFDSRYLDGFLADRFDSPPDSELPRAQKFMISVARDKFIESASGFGKLTVNESSLRLDNPSVEYAMLPVYLFNCKYQGNTYQYAINGQTGKFTGKFPESKSKKKFLALRSFFIPAGILYAILLLIQIFF